MARRGNVKKADPNKYQINAIHPEQYGSLLSASVGKAWHNLFLGQKTRSGKELRQVGENRFFIPPFSLAFTSPGRHVFVVSVPGSVELSVPIHVLAEGSPREVVTFSYPGGKFKKADYPWAKEIRVTLRGGDSADGNPGEIMSQQLTLDDLDPETDVTVGGGANAFAIVELFD